MKRFSLVVFAAACQSANYILGLALYLCTLGLTGDVSLALAAQRLSGGVLFVAVCLQGLLAAFWPKRKPSKAKKKSRPRNKRTSAPEMLEWVIEFGRNGNLNG